MRDADRLEAGVLDAVEQPLTVAEEDRNDIEGELVDRLCREGLPSGRGAAPSTNSAAAEACRLAHGVEVRDRLAVLTQDTALEIGLDAAEALARHDGHPDRDQRHRLLVDDPLELARP